MGEHPEETVRCLEAVPGEDLEVAGTGRRAQRTETSPSEPSVEGSPDTPGKVSPDKEFEMKFVNGKLDMPDGREVEFWTFEDQLRDTEEDVILPGSPIRVVEGDIVHVTVKPSKRQHTIHLHGVEADTHNDGVGHTSFEVTGSYTYQFRAGAPFR